MPRPRTSTTRTDAQRRAENKYKNKAQIVLACRMDRQTGERYKAICAERERLLVELATLPQTTVFPSLANMILLRVPASVGGSAAVFAALKAQGVLVKNVAAMHPLLANCLRLTVGTPEENDKLLAALRLVLV